MTVHGCSWESWIKCNQICLGAWVGSQRDVFSCSRQIAWPQDLTVAGHRSPKCVEPLDWPISWISANNSPCSLMRDSPVKHFTKEGGAWFKVHLAPTEQVLTPSQWRSQTQCFQQNLALPCNNWHNYLPAARLEPNLLSHSSVPCCTADDGAEQCQRRGKTPEATAAWMSRFTQGAGACLRSWIRAWYQADGLHL